MAALHPIEVLKQSTCAIAYGTLHAPCIHHAAPTAGPGSCCNDVSSLLPAIPVRNRLPPLAAASRLRPPSRATHATRTLPTAARSPATSRPLGLGRRLLVPGQRMGLRWRNALQPCSEVQRLEMLDVGLEATARNAPLEQIHPMRSLCSQAVCGVQRALSRLRRVSMPDVKHGAE